MRNIFDFSISVYFLLSRRKISESMSEAAKKLSQFLGSQLEALQRELDDLYKLIVDYINSLPGFEALKQKYQEVGDISFDFHLTFDLYFKCFTFVFALRFVVVAANSTR